MKWVLPAAGEIVDAILDVVFAKLQHQLAALERRVIQEHGNQPHQPVAALFRLLQNFALPLFHLPERTRKQKIVVALHHRQRRFQFVRGRGQKHRLLPVHFLQPQIGCQKIAVGNFPLLHQILHGLPHLRFIRRRSGRQRLDVNNQPIRFRQPAQTCPALADRRLDRKTNFLLATFELPQNVVVIRLQNLREKIGLRGSQPHGLEKILGMQVGEENPAAPIRHNQRPVQRVQQARK